jgi:hypothetical protein
MIAEDSNGSLHVEGLRKDNYYLESQGRQVNPSGIFSLKSR